MKIKAFSTLEEISHFAISGYFVIYGFDITGVDCMSKFIRSHVNSVLPYRMKLGFCYFPPGNPSSANITIPFFRDATLALGNY